MPHIFGKALLLPSFLLFPWRGFNIQHDGGHRAYSRNNAINKLAAHTMDLIGGSSYVWWWKHVAFHHRYVNIAGYDPDVEAGPIVRLAPHQKRRWFHRWQHIYMWLFYCLLAIKWHLYDDFKSVITGRLGRLRIPRPRGIDLALFIAGKALFLSLVFIIPLQLHSFSTVALFYAFTAGVLGLLMAMVFQLPHVVPQTGFPLPAAEDSGMEMPWAVHMVNVTLDFSRGNRVLTWPLGGLNYHLEHHLFPVLCHINYPAIFRIVRQTCKDFGVEYKEHRTFGEGIVAHYQWLKFMGSEEPQRKEKVEGED